MSKKGVQFSKFGVGVLDHIDNYVVPQYGDHPDDQLKGMTKKDVQFQLERYVKRITTNARPNEAARDALKIAHYACYLHSLVTGGTADGLG